MLASVQHCRLTGNVFASIETPSAGFHTLFQQTSYLLDKVKKIHHGCLLSTLSHSLFLSLRSTIRWQSTHWALLPFNFSALIAEVSGVELT